MRSKSANAEQGSSREVARNGCHFAIPVKPGAQHRYRMPAMRSATATSPLINSVELKKILVPVDFSAPSQQALRYALRFAKLLAAQVTLLHVLERAAPLEDIADLPIQHAHADRQLTVAEKNLRALSASSEAARSPEIGTTIREGLPAHEIVEAAKEFDSDLIVIATHGYTGWKHFCIGSTAERVARTATCPVLVVREKQYDLV